MYYHVILTLTANANTNPDANANANANRNPNPKYNRKWVQYWQYIKVIALPSESNVEIHRTAKPTSQPGRLLGLWAGLLGLFLG